MTFFPKADMERSSPDDALPRLPRRRVLQWFAAMAAASGTGQRNSFAQGAAPGAKGYGTDPNLVTPHTPGDVWPLTLSAPEKKAATALADVVLPADELGPAASALRVPDLVDEWVSAPYPQQREDREVIVPGLKWIDEVSQRRHQKPFADLKIEEQRAICDDLCQPDQTDPGLRKAAAFFHLFTGICLGAYYATPEGWKAIGYVGNLPTITFEGPPQEVLDRLGLEQTVK